jgi:hypothetical protein
MDDLVAWLLAQIAEDGAAARACSDDALGDITTWVDYTSGDEFARSVAHFQRHTPARVLAECEAKRLLLQQFALRGDSVRATVVPATGGVWDDLLRMLALPYADRPGYRNEWKP